MPKSALRAVDSAKVHNRDLARKLVKRWKSDAERHHLPVSNEHDGKGAPLLNVQTVMQRDYDDHTRRLGRK